MRREVFSAVAEKFAAEARSEAIQIVRDLVHMHGRKKLDAVFDDVARASGLSARRIKTFWYGEDTTVAAHELRCLQHALDKQMTAELARAAHREAIWRRMRGAGREDHPSDARGILVHAAA